METDMESIDQEPTMETINPYQEYTDDTEKEGKGNINYIKTFYNNNLKCILLVSRQLLYFYRLLFYTRRV